MRQVSVVLPTKNEEKWKILKKQSFSFSTNLFLGRKALPKEPYFLSTGSFFRKKVL